MPDGCQDWRGSSIQLLAADAADCVSELSHSGMSVKEAIGPMTAPHSPGPGLGEQKHSASWAQGTSSNYRSNTERELPSSRY